MAGGGVAPLGVKKERAAQYRGRVTPYVVFACLIAAVGGSIFGYDIGISGKDITSIDLLYLIIWYLRFNFELKLLISVVVES
jgi:hypothetical protein